MIKTKIKIKIICCLKNRRKKNYKFTEKKLFILFNYLFIYLAKKKKKRKPPKQ